MAKRSDIVAAGSQRFQSLRMAGKRSASRGQGSRSLRCSRRWARELREAPGRLSLTVSDVRTLPEARAPPFRRPGSFPEPRSGRRTGENRPPGCPEAPDPVVEAFPDARGAPQTVLDAFREAPRRPFPVLRSFREPRSGRQNGRIPAPGCPNAPVSDGRALPDARNAPISVKNELPDAPEQPDPVAGKLPEAPGTATDGSMDEDGGGKGRPLPPTKRAPASPRQAPPARPPPGSPGCGAGRCGRCTGTGRAGPRRSRASGGTPPRGGTRRRRARTG